MSITINSQLPRKEYVAGVGQTVFTYDFPIYAEGDLEVYQATGDPEPSDILTLNTDYTVQGVGVASGGTITLVTPATGGETVVIRGNDDIERLTNFQVQGPFEAEEINRQLNDLTIYMKQLESETVKRYGEDLPEVDYPLIVPNGVIATHAINLGQLQAYSFTAVSVNSPVLSSITALKALDVSTNSHAFVTGYYAEGDGGGGEYYLDTGSSETDNGGTIIAPDVGSGRWKLLTDAIYANQFGAEPSQSAAVNGQAIDNALSWMVTSGRRGKLTLKPGSYFTDRTADVLGLGVGFGGEAASEAVTVLIGTHTDGPVVKLNNRGQFCEYLEIEADATRQAGGTGQNFGLLIEPADSVGIEVLDITIHRVYIQNQPHSAFVCSGPVYTVDVSECVFRNSDRHGVQLDYGSLTSRTNTGLPGIMTFRNCRIFDNEGHGVLLGNDDNDSNRCIRVELKQCDISRNAEGAGSGRKSADQIWGYGSNCLIERCGINGLNQAQSAATTRAGLLHGPNWKLINNRVLQTTPQAFRFSVHGTQTFETSFTLDDIYCIQTSPGASNHNPAVLVDPEVSRFSAKTQFYNDIDRLTSDAALPGREKRLIVANKVSAEPVTNSAALIDDATLKLPMIANERMQFTASLQVNGPDAGNIKIAFTVPAGASLSWSPVGGMKVDTSLNVVQQGVETVSGAAVSFGVPASGDQMISIEGEVIGGGTAGDLQMQWAQNTADASPTNMLGQSWLGGYKE